MPRVASVTSVAIAASATGREISPLARGSRTVNVLPKPGPALAARIVPPCICTIARTRARPIPRPPPARGCCNLTWENISKTCSSAAGGMPTPLSVTAMTASSASRSNVIRMRPPASVYLTLLDQIRENLDEPVGIALQYEIAGAHVGGERMAAGFQRRAGALERASQNVQERHLLDAQPQLAVRHPADIEQVIHEAHQVTELPLHDPERALRDRLDRAATLQQ